jgi:uncharacterized RDD family membrane protein YckC
LTGGIRPAAFQTRAGAWAIDAVPHALVPYVVGRVTDSIAFAVAAFLIVGITWSVLPEARAGVTLGKLLTGLRTVRQGTVHPIGLGRAAVRWLVKYPVGGVLPVSYLWYFRDPQRRTWHDLAAGSVVIDIVGVRAPSSSGDRPA